MFPVCRIFVQHPGPEGECEGEDEGYVSKGVKSTVQSSAVVECRGIGGSILTL